MKIDFDQNKFQNVIERNCFETREKWKQFTKVYIFYYLGSNF